ncbi:conserved Plasmodium membrane protein, unknown function [Plasmodium ovale wallikeri]|uniref:Uncharacterized protein n=1 Tax=Plasmodium ovale wallikeri TaxID=864142 RepID=A0A1A8YIX7_PLAOA|nr:conserved Plasmodium membrane protein, unknown function [Plasmodium ovale wallikeri]
MLRPSEKVARQSTELQSRATLHKGWDTLARKRKVPLIRTIQGTRKMNTTDDDRLGLCGGFIAKGVDLLETGIDWRRNNPDDRHDDDDNVPGGDAPPRACEKKRKDLYNGVGVTLFDYIYEMVNGRSELRKLQMKLTLYSANRCIDFFNDMMFLLNIFYKIYFGLDSREKTVHVYNIIFLWLLMIFITSMSTFYFRKLLILNFVPHRHSNLFTLWKVFKEVKITDQRDISALYFYERFQKTYFIINNFLEDIPQFFLYSLYTILDGQDVYLVFAMVSSVGFIVVRTFYQGIHCPAIGTRHLFFSTHLVEDSFVQCDVAPTTNAFFLYSAVGKEMESRQCDSMAVWQCDSVAVWQCSNSFVFVRP